jgi:hypothetical protein
MPAYTFNSILDKAAARGISPGRTIDARNWFRTAAKKTKGISAERIYSESSKSAMTSTVKMGKMYMFFYDPKQKKTLPYYDRFPLIFPFDKAKGGFMGLNLHYLPPKLRAILMDSLYDLASDKQYTQATKLKLSYNVLKSAGKYKWFKPCIKHYLSDHVRSRFIEIDASQWDMALFLNVAKFEGASQSKVWADSRASV